MMNTAASRLSPADRALLSAIATVTADLDPVNDNFAGEALAADRRPWTCDDRQSIAIEYRRGREVETAAKGVLHSAEWLVNFFPNPSRLHLMCKTPQSFRVLRQTRAVRAILRGAGWKV